MTPTKWLTISILLAAGLLLWMANACGSEIPGDYSYLKYKTEVARALEHQDTIQSEKVMAAYPGYSSRWITTTIDSVYYYFGNDDHVTAVRYLNRLNRLAQHLDRDVFPPGLFKEIEFIRKASREKLQTVIRLLKKAQSLVADIQLARGQLQDKADSLELIAGQLEQSSLIRLAERTRLDRVNNTYALKGFHDDTNLNRIAFSAMEAGAFDLAAEAVMSKSRLIMMLGPGQASTWIQFNIPQFEKLKLPSVVGRFHLLLALDKAAGWETELAAAESLLKTCQDSDGLANLKIIHSQKKTGQGDYSGALTLLEELDHQPKAGLRNQTMARLYLSRARLDEKTGQPEKAEERYLLALDAARAAGEIRLKSDIMIGLAELELDLLKYEEAQRLLTICETLHRYAENDQGLGNIFRLRGRLALEQNNISEAESWIEQARRHHRRYENRTGLLAVELFQAALLERRGKPVLALELRTQLADSLARTGPLMSPGANLLAADNQLEVARLLIEQGRPGEAGPVLSEFAGRERQTQNERLRARYLLLQGSVDMSNGDIGGGVKRLEQAASSAEKISATRLSLDALSALAGGYDRLGRPGPALETGRRAVELLERSRVHFETEKGKTSFLMMARRVYSDQIVRLLEGKNETANLEACYLLSLLRGRILADMLEASRGLSGKPLIPAELSKARSDAINDIQAHQRTLRTQSLDENKQKLVSDSLLAARDRLSRVDSDIALRFPAYPTVFTGTQPLPIFYVQQHQVPDQTAVLEYFLAEKNSWVFVLTRDTLLVHELGLPAGQIEQQTDQLLEPLRRAENLADLPFDTGLAGRLAGRLVMDALGKIRAGQTENLVIVPDGKLNLLPFEMLITGGKLEAYTETNLYQELSGFEFLIDRFNITYLPALDLLKAADQESEGEKSASIFCIGDPVLDKAGAGPQVAAGERYSFGQLEFAGPELEGIKNIFGPQRAFVASGQSATESELRNSAGGHAYVHIATHAVYEPANPLYSKLVFTPLPDGSDDGFLQVWEVFGLSLSPRLVFLNACQTGVGAIIESEGLMGMPRAFLGTGAGSVIVNLWSVNDQASADLAILFYKKLATDNLRPAAALRHAKMELRKTYRPFGPVQIHYTHPVFWAAPVMVGNGL